MLQVNDIIPQRKQQQIAVAMEFELVADVCFVVIQRIHADVKFIGNILCLHT